MAARERWRDVVVVLATGLLAAGALALVTGPLRGVDAAVASHEVPWWALVPLFLAAELCVVHLQVRRESISATPAEIPLVLGLAFCDPTGYVAASVLGSALGLLWQRRFGLALLFNLALFAFEAALSQTIYHAVLAGGDPTSVRGLVAAVTAIVATQAISAPTLIGVIAVKAGRFPEGALREAVVSVLVVSLGNASVGLLGVVLLVTRPGALVPLLVVVAVLVVAYRGYSTLSRGHARLESLYRFTDRIGGAVRTERVAEAVLVEARDELAAESAELVLLPTGTEPGTHLRLTGTTVVPVPFEAAPAWWTPALDGEPLLRPAGDGTPRDGIAAPLRVEDTVVGVLLVTDRPDHLDTFGEADLRLFVSLANHAGLSLHKAHLVDRLAAEAAAQEHRSLHDPLTGLPNRRHFLRLLRNRLADEPRTAVVLLDLDGFKDVNEAFGHATGDRLLAEVGRRLADRLGATSVARLGNDEFAALVPAVADAEDARTRVAALVAALSVPFPVEGLTVDVRVTAGLAVAPEHGEDAAGLLQHADTALYAAKHQRTDVAVYDSAADRASHRLRMTGQLRDAIAAGDLTVHYQPKTDPATGRTAGVEALVRWEHPEHGRVGPDEFIPLAEQTGLIRPLTTLVLDTALAACAGWRRQGHHLGVAVNLSTRSLTDAELPARVGEALRRAGLPAAALTLEITETAVMADLGRSVAVLQELRALGVRLSVDDFGTGQSSLAYLKQLPIHEVKIDKAFVLGLADDDGDAAIVRAALSLGHALGLRVVAEGVEDAVTLALLADWGCDLVQGFHVSRPLPLDRLAEWLAAHGPAGPVTARAAVAAPGR
ncbi:bifunctional diguanylate cyclase/phosphodiesterase [Geodermatophilus sp. DSM 45219]|uniref:putative bifunctional diguanylate cyclase/phosphodiesterase n=1 Tax=Geodermatophilus sp. DSM 45219 TaxID=1881103 RepID=UPI00088147C1|nr:EAL domain-containing protein [Geodermatophilus sp. DSM 45219]SDN47699.1 diguanylate cyclase (GGDEF) domain-containing protein [Geodermatophilus sp. DSM 45219]